MRIVYLHGVGGGSFGKKAASLVKHFGADNVSAPSLPIDPVQTEAIVDKIVKETTSFPLVFVGVSLGGFWANYFAQKWDAPCVIVNPSTNPSVSLKRYNVPQDVLDGYNHYETVRTQNDSNGSLVNLFVAKNDPILPYAGILKTYEHTAFTAVLPDGGHRFDKNWNLVIDRIAEIVK
jgi:uncharacterized protein